MKVEGIISPGYGIASKGSLKTQELVSNIQPGKKVIVDQTVYRQFPFFVEAGVADIKDMHPGTINVEISPYEFAIISPDYTVTCEWIEGVQETFMLTEVSVLFEEKRIKGYIYYPMVSEQHAPRNSMVEIITYKIPGVEYGKQISIELPESSIEVSLKKSGA